MPLRGRSRCYVWHPALREFDGLDRQQVQRRARRVTRCGIPPRDLPVIEHGLLHRARRGACALLARPDVVWFGETLDPAVLQAAREASARAATMIVIGTSALVQPAASLPLLAKRNGARLVEINPDETPLSVYADEVLRGRAAVELPKWWDANSKTLRRL